MHRLVINPSRGPNNLYIYELQQIIGRGLLQRKTGKNLKTWLSICAVWLYAVFMFLFISRKVSGEGNGIRFYRFPIIAVPSTLSPHPQ